MYRIPVQNLAVRGLLREAGLRNICNWIATCNTSLWVKRQETWRMHVAAETCHYRWLIYYMALAVYMPACSSLTAKPFMTCTDITSLNVQGCRHWRSFGGFSPPRFWGSICIIYRHKGICCTNKSWDILQIMLCRWCYSCMLHLRAVRVGWGILGQRQWADTTALIAFSSSTDNRIMWCHRIHYTGVRVSMRPVSIPLLLAGTLSHQLFILLQ